MKKTSASHLEVDRRCRELAQRQDLSRDEKMELLALYREIEHSKDVDDQVEDIRRQLYPERDSAT